MYLQSRDSNNDQGETSERGRRLNAFISHASKDSRFAAQLVGALELDGLKAWIDHSDVRFGVLLRNELQSAIRNCRVLVLVWSKAASISRWVMAEMLTAFHCNRFIIPCVLDRTQLPQFLQNTAYLDRRRDKLRRIHSWRRLNTFSSRFSASNRWTQPR